MTLRDCRVQAPRCDTGAIDLLAFGAKVFSMIDRPLLELIEKVNPLIAMLETACIDDVITPSQLLIEKR